MPKDLEFTYLIDFYGDVLTDKQREVVEQYYCDDLSLSEIAENFDITRQGVRDSIKRAEGIMQDLEDKIGYARRYRALQEKMSELETLARDVDFQNDGLGFNRSDKISTDVARMLEIIGSLND